MNSRINLKTTEFTPMEKEFVRKGVHMSISFLPFLVSINYTLAVNLVISGIFVYLLSESLRSRGKSLGLVTKITQIASRSRDKGLTLGPLTLAIGALVPVLLFSPMAFTCGIFALAFGDGLSSVTGKLWGKVKIPFTGGKSVIGSLTCFTMILSTTYGITGDIGKALAAGIVGTIVELIPAKDLDNLLIPTVVAIIVTVV